MRTNNLTTKDTIGVVLVAGLLGLFGTGAYTVLDTSRNRVSTSIDGSIQSLSVHDGFPYIADERVKLTCNDNVLRVREQTALFVPIYWDGGAGEFVAQIRDCTPGSIRELVATQKGFVFTQHVLANMQTYVNP